MKRAICLILLTSLFLAGCSKAAEPVQETVFCMDTVMDLKIWGEDAQEGIRLSSALLNELERTWSVTDEGSLLSQINLGQSPELTQEQAELLQRVSELSQRTGGAFNPRLKALSQAWGF